MTMFLSTLSNMLSLLTICANYDISITDSTSLVQKGNIHDTPRGPKSRNERLKVHFADDPVDDEDFDKVDLSFHRLERIRNALEDLVYSSCCHTTGGEEQFDVFRSSSPHFIGCINAIKNADETFLNMFESIQLSDKGNIVTSLKTTEVQVVSDKERIESSDVDHHHTTDLDDDNMMALPSLSVEQSRSMDVFDDVPMITWIEAKKEESYPSGYGANDLIHDVKEWLSTRYRPQHEACTTAIEEDSYHYGELITSQCHFVIVILYLLSINDSVKDIHLQRVGKKLRPLHASRKVISHGSTRVAAYKMKKNGKLINYYKEQVATGRFLITYTTAGHKISVDLAYLTNDDLAHVRHQRSSSVYIRATKYISRTLFEGYIGDELVAVDTWCHADIGRLCYYHFQPLSVCKLPMLLLHQACKVLQSDLIFASQQDHASEPPLSYPMVDRPRHTLQCITNIALVFVRNNCTVHNSEMIDNSPFDLFSDSTFQYV